LKTSETSLRLKCELTLTIGLRDLQPVTVQPGLAAAAYANYSTVEVGDYLERVPREWAIFNEEVGDECYLTGTELFDILTALILGEDPIKVAKWQKRNSTSSKGETPQS
jgi:hypothetical protein